MAHDSSPTRRLRIRAWRVVMITGIMAAGLLGFAPAASATTVPNIYVRQCTSWYRSHCNAYQQTNGPHNNSVPNAFYTQYVWYWV